MDDLISRQAVLDMLEDINAETEGVGFYYEHYIDYIKALPPVKPQEPKTEKVIKMRDATPEEQKLVDDYIKSISKPTGIEFDIDIPKKIESYKKLLKHPVIKHVMDMDETPVTLSISENPNNCDLISREEVEEIINDIRNCISVEGYWAILERMKKLPSIKPQTGHWIMQHRKVNTINYRTGEDVLTGEIHTVKELIRYECDEPYCSECGKRAGDTSGNYCCFCGARMESEQNG